MYKKLQFYGQLACMRRAAFRGFLVFACLVAACSTRDVVIGARGTEERPELPQTPAQPPAVETPPQAGTMMIETSTAAGGMPARAATAGMPAREEDAAVGGGPRTSAGCGKAPVNGDNFIATPAGPGTYLFDLPSPYDNRQPYALLFAFRSVETSLEAFREELNIGAVAGQSAIIVHPESLGGPGSMWSVPKDLPFFDDLLAQMLDRYCIDPSRVFVFGYAMGGFFASALACSRGDRLRGGALIAGTMPVGPCVGNIAMFLAQGDMDPVYPLRAGRMTRDFWTRKNHCDPAYSTTPALPPPCLDYGGCSEDTPVRYCEYSGGHELPSWAASASWDFFSALR